MNAVERSWEMARQVERGLQPPEKLEEVVTPLSLPSFVPPANWESLREWARKIEEVKGKAAEVVGKLSEVEMALRGLDARRPKDSARAAEAFLAGKTLAPEPEAKAEGLAAMGRESLQVVRDGLQAKRAELESSLEWTRGRLRGAEVDVLRAAVAAASNQYCDRIRDEVAPLHIAIDGGAGLLSAAMRDMTSTEFRREKFLAPALADRSKTIPTEIYGPLVADFSLGGGVPGVMETWRRAVKAACGIASL